MIGELDKNMAVDIAYFLGVLHARKDHWASDLQILMSVSKAVSNYSQEIASGFEADEMQSVIDAYNEGLDLLWSPNETDSIPPRPGSNVMVNFFYNDADYWQKARERAEEIIASGK